MEETIDVGLARRVLENHGLSGSNGRVAQTIEMLIPLLQDLQNAYGYLPREILEWVNQQTGIPISRMYGVITFYSQFYLEKRGRHIVRCCEGTACHVKGAPLVVDAIERELGIGSGETSEDGEFTLETVNCLGACALAPLIVVDNEYHGKMNQDKAQKIVATMKES
jgi:NADH-quinone oxidoreductase subunit E